jgi:beta-N-acetylhexosaminidase
VNRELERLAAGCLCPSFPGHEAPDWARRWLARGLGGVTLFAYNVGEPEQVRRLTDALRAERPDVLVSIDEEGGDVTRLEARQGSSSPGNLALGAVDDVGLTREVAAAIADLLVAAGIGLNLAPVADVNTNPDNPVIGVRSFGSDPGLVARHVAAFVEGTQSRGVAACAKHFPGHGDTAVDSHLGLPVVEGDLGGALEPFRAAIAAGVAAVMTGHLLVPALDDVPTTVSGALVGGLLRGELGFDGLVVSDALEMGGISAGVGVEEGAVRALAAGVDLLCLGHDLHEEAVERVHRAICDAVVGGRLPLGRLEEAAARIAAVSRAPAAPGSSSGMPGAAAARRALRVTGVPALAGPPLVVELRPTANIAAGEHEHGLAEHLPGSVAVTLTAAPASAEALLDDQRPLVLVLRDAARHELQQQLARELVALRPDTVVIETGLPGWTAPGAAATIETHGASRASLAAAAELLRTWSVSGSNR